MRAVFETLGMHDVVAKSMGSSNPYNMVRATFDALKSQMHPQAMWLPRRGIKVFDDLQARRGSAVAAERVVDGQGALTMAKKATKTSHRRADRFAASAARSDQRATLIGLGLNKMHNAARRWKIRLPCAA